MNTHTIAKYTMGGMLTRSGQHLYFTIPLEVSNQPGVLNSVLTSKKKYPLLNHKCHFLLHLCAPGSSLSITESDPVIVWLVVRVQANLVTSLKCKNVVQRGKVSTSCWTQTTHISSLVLLLIHYTKTKLSLSFLFQAWLFLGVSLELPLSQSLVHGSQSSA